MVMGGGGEKTQFDVESIDHLLIVVYEWTRGDWYTHVSACVCVCIYIHAYIYTV